jgi:hypothetical protein
MTAILAIGVLCDDSAKYDEAVAYFEHGDGNGAIAHAATFVYPGGLAQWQETGRDQEHAQLGVGMMSVFCQIAWNQGDDLYAYDDNRFLKAAEYVAAYNMWKPVPYTFYNNADDVNNYWASEQTWGGRGRLQRPIWELIYNHYAVLKGLSAPNVKAMAEIYRPEGIQHDDNFGFGTLTFTLDAAKSPYPPKAIDAAPTGLVADASVGRVYLSWNPVPGANGYTVQRADSPGGPFNALATYTGTFPVFVDDHVTDGTAYAYRVAANNQAGSGPLSTAATATPSDTHPLADGWTAADLGTCAKPGTAAMADVSGGTFVLSGSGAGLGGTADGVSFAYQKISGDFTFTARRAEVGFGGGRWQKIGIMARSSTDPGASAFAMVAGDVGAREAKLGTRTAAGAPMTWQNGNAYTFNQTWFRIQRTGDTFTAYQSIDGQTWFAVGAPVPIPMGADSLVGFVIGSNSDNIAAATFDHVTMKRVKQ